MNKKSIILFGSGKIGREILELLGTELVIFFVDNNIKNDERNKVKDIDVISFSEYKAIYRSYITVISTKNIYEKQIAQQLLNSGIIEFIFWEEIVSIFNNDIKESFQVNEVIGRDDKWIENTLRFIQKQVSLIQDSSSEVEFYLIDSFEISHFLPIYQALKRNGIKACFVAEPPAINSADSWFDYQEAINILHRKNIDYCTLRNPNAKVAFTTQFARNLKYYNGIKCQMSYGAVVMKEKAFQIKKEVAMQFDYIFTNGELYKNILTQWLLPSQVVDMSYPRYLEDFERKTDKEEILSELKIKTDKPIIVYYPTWDEYSSIQLYEKTLNQLRKDFYLISKPHHCVWRSNDKMESLLRCSDLVLDGKFDLYKTAIITDCAICDARSGVVTEVAFLNRDIHMVLIYYNLEDKEFHIDIDNFACGVKRPSDLIATVKSVINNDEKIFLRKSMIDDMYSCDIRCGINRAIKKICECLES